MSKRDEVADVIAEYTTGRWSPAGLADAVISTMREPSVAQTEAMARQINRVAGFGNVSGRDVYQAAIDAAESDR